MLSDTKTTPNYTPSPGMTVCLDCGSLIATPRNVISKEFLGEHVGHRIEIVLAAVESDLERAVVEATTKRRELDDQDYPGIINDVFEADKRVRNAVDALIAAREKK